MKQREIKFRAWDIYDKRMLTVGDIIMMSPDGSFIQYAEQGFLCNNLDAPESHKEFLRTKNIEIRDEFVLMQYTGLKDKNGKEIYEGDICLIPDFRRGIYITGKQPVRKVVMEYSNGFHGADFHGVEIIGNIYENPELLNKQP